MENKETTIRIDNKVYPVMIFSVDNEVYWRVRSYASKKDSIAKRIQEKCGYSITNFGFSDFGIIDNTAYWESRTKSTIKE